MEDQVRQEFVQRATEYLEANATRRVQKTEDFVWGEGDGSVRVMAGETMPTRGASPARPRSGGPRRSTPAFGWPGGPGSTAAAGATPSSTTSTASWRREFDVPDQGAFGVAWDMVAPAVLVHGSEDLKRRYLAPIYRGDLLCSQLLSEPEAGSRPRRPAHHERSSDGDEWVVNGQKVWNSYAHKAQIGQLMARTDPDVPKHQGLTMFLLPMDTRASRSVRSSR